MTGPSGKGPAVDTENGFDFTPLKPERIQGAEHVPRMEFVPKGMEEPSHHDPTKKDLEPFREVAVTPMDYLRTHEERSLFLSHVRYRIGALPFSNTNIFILQVAAIISLYITIAVNFHINDPQTSILGELWPEFNDYLLWNSPLQAAIIVILPGYDHHSAILNKLFNFSFGSAIQHVIIFSQRAVSDPEDVGLLKPRQIRLIDLLARKFIFTQLGDPAQSAKLGMVFPVGQDQHLYVFFGCLFEPWSRLPRQNHITLFQDFPDFFL